MTQANGKQLKELYVSTSLRRFLAPADFYSPDCQIGFTVYRRMSLAYFGYLWRAFNRAQGVYMTTDLITDAQWQITRERWREVIALAFDALDLHNATEDQLAVLLITPAADDPDQYLRVPLEVNIFTAHSDYGSRSAAPEIPVTPAQPRAAVSTNAQTQKPTGASCRTQQKGLF